MLRLRLEWMLRTLHMVAGSSRRTACSSRMESVSHSCPRSIERANAQLGDPWRDATVSADGTDFSSTSMQSIAVGDGFHCSDYYAQNAQDPTIAAVQNKGLAAIQEWLSSWTPPADSARA